jgi:hypothetical protein
MTLAVGKGAGGAPGLEGVVGVCGVGEGIGVGVVVGVVEQDVGVGEVIGVPAPMMGVPVDTAPGWPGTWFVPQATGAINRAMKSKSSTNRRMLACISQSPFPFPCGSRIILSIEGLL